MYTGQALRNTEPYNYILQLPEVTDLKTGEEDETAVYSQRAKLFRYDNSQWKERGIGEMKILKHNETGE